MSIGKITMNELSDSLRTYLENLDTSTVEMNSLVISEAIDDTDDKNDCLNKVIKDNGDILYICPTGKTISSVTLNWEINKTTDITSASIAIKQKSDSAYTTLVYGNDAIEVISSGNYTISNDNHYNNYNVALTNNTTIKIIVTYNSNGVSKNFAKNLALYFSNPLLYGKVKYTGEEKDSEGNTISFINYIKTKTESFVNINSVFVYWDDLNMTFNINCKKDEYEYITFMLPIYKDINFFINGLNGGIDRVGNCTYNDTTFYVFKSNQPCLGNCEVTIKRLNTTSTTSDD